MFADEKVNCVWKTRWMGRRSRELWCAMIFFQSILCACMCMCMCHQMMTLYTNIPWLDRLNIKFTESKVCLIGLVTKSATYTRILNQIPFRSGFVRKSQKKKTNHSMRVHDWKSARKRPMCMFHRLEFAWNWAVLHRWQIAICVIKMWPCFLFGIFVVSLCFCCHHQRHRCRYAFNVPGEIITCRWSATVINLIVYHRCCATYASAIFCI